MIIDSFVAVPAASSMWTVQRCISNSKFASAGDVFVYFYAAFSGYGRWGRVQSNPSNPPFARSQFAVCLSVCFLSAANSGLSADCSVVGRTVVFGADTGVCVHGHVILRHDVIADQWLTVRISLAAFLLLVAQIEPGHRSLGQRFWPGRITGQVSDPMGDVTF